MSDLTEKERIRQKHLSAVNAILTRETVELTPDNVVNLLAYLHSVRAFQELAIRAIASSAVGQADWNAIEGMVDTAETSDKFLDRLLEKLSGLKIDE